MKASKELEKILSDKTSGSSEILLKLNNYFRKIIDEPEKFSLTIRLVKKELPYFTSIDNYIKHLENICPSEDKKVVIDFITSFDEISYNKYQRIYENAKPVLKNLKTVLTISNSKTIAEFFKLWRKDNKQLKVIVCESRPKNEGRIFTKALLKENIKVEFITDFMISHYFPKVDAVILGADSILKNGNVINKTGSLSAALLCRQFKKPCYVLASKDKFTNKKTFYQKEQNKNEVWNFRHMLLTINNIYFEEVSKKFITKLITE